MVGGHLFIIDSVYAYFGAAQLLIKVESKALEFHRYTVVRVTGM